MSHRGFVSDYYDRSSLDRLLRDLEEGDLLEIDRTYYKHWTICVKVDGKNTMVVHRYSNCSANQFFFESYSTNKRKHGVGSIVEQLLIDVLEANKVRINNSYDLKTATIFSSKVIVKRAYMYVNNEDEVGEYNVSNNNCEHFAKLCRNDVKHSEQAEIAATAAGAVAGGVVGVAAVVGIAALFNSFINSRQRENNQ